MKKSIVITSLLIVASYISGFAQKPAVVSSAKAGWHKIASQHVGYKTDKDEIAVMGNDRFREIKLIARNNNVELKSFDVYFEGDTTVQVVPVPKTLMPGEESASTMLTRDLPIKRIVLVYKTMGGNEMKTRPGEKEREKEKAEVEIWGLK